MKRGERGRAREGESKGLFFTSNPLERGKEGRERRKKEGGPSYVCSHVFVCTCGYTPLSHTISTHTNTNL